MQPAPGPPVVTEHRQSEARRYSDAGGLRRQRPSPESDTGALAAMRVRVPPSPLFIVFRPPAAGSGFHVTLRRYGLLRFVEPRS